MISSPLCDKRRNLDFFQLSCLHRSCVGYCLNTNMIASTMFACTTHPKEYCRYFRNMAFEFEPHDCCRYLFNDAEVKTFDPCQIAAECFGGVMTVGDSPRCYNTLCQISQISHDSHRFLCVFLSHEHIRFPYRFI